MATALFTVERVIRACERCIDDVEAHRRGLQADLDRRAAKPWWHLDKPDAFERSIPNIARQYQLEAARRILALARGAASGVVQLTDQDYDHIGLYMPGCEE